MPRLNISHRLKALETRADTRAALYQAPPGYRERALEMLGACFAKMFDLETIPTREEVEGILCEQLKPA